MTRDFAGMMAIYAPDAREMLPGMPAAGTIAGKADRGPDRADAYHVWGS